ncbi:MAG TPA: ABC transporter permease [Acetobacteraceae bacterium]|nr:ABC transporter permease [Acetobacteraceae bacterium]
MCKNKAPLGALPFVVLGVAWLLAPMLAQIPPYALPTPGDVLERLRSGVADGSLPRDVLASLSRLLLGFCIGNGLAIPLGIAIALNRWVSDLLRPVLTFLASIGGIAWVPLAALWLGVGPGAVLFVIVNQIFFSTIYNTVNGVEAIPPVLRRAVLSHGARGVQVLKELIVPGALVELIVGLRTSMAYGWRALVAAEMIAGTNGIGFRVIAAVQWYQTDTVVLGMLVIGVLWLLLDELLFTRLERATVVRWGLLRETA